MKDSRPSSSPKPPSPVSHAAGDDEVKPFVPHAEALVEGILAPSAAPDLKALLDEQEKRTHPRVVAHFPYVLLTRDSDGQEMKLGGYTEDLSLQGVSIASAAHLPLHTVLAIRLDLTVNGQIVPVVATGTCVHKTFSAKLGGFRYGIQFVKMANEARNAIQAYVAGRKH